MPKDVEQLSIDTIRALAMDSVQKANAGHPGTAMALAERLAGSSLTARTDGPLGNGWAGDWLAADRDCGLVLAPVG